MPSTATPLRLGRRAPKNARALDLGKFLTGTIPTPPASVDDGAYFSGWQMLGNDVAGDCVAVTWANQRALVTAALEGTAHYPTQHQVWTFYKTQNPHFNPSGSSTTNGPGSQDDNGMDIQTALEHLTKVGGPDGTKAVAFARVNYQDEKQLRAAHAIFGQVWYGITVLDANQDEFNQGKPWKYVEDSPTEGGHSVTGIGYTPKDYNFVTWGKATEWTESVRRKLVEEAWIVIWPEHLGTTQFQEGVDLDQLASDYQAITGQKLEIPTKR
jgi:hypothetical protein